MDNFEILKIFATVLSLFVKIYELAENQKANTKSSKKRRKRSEISNLKPRDPGIHHLD
jgi:hypothetical protein